MTPSEIVIALMAFVLGLLTGWLWSERAHMPLIKNLQQTNMDLVMELMKRREPAPEQERAND